MSHNRLEQQIAAKAKKLKNSNQTTQDESTGLIARKRKRKLTKTSVKMSAQKARVLLQLIDDYPLPAQINAAAELLLEKHCPDKNGGNFRKWNSILHAKKALLAQQNKILHYYEVDIHKAARTYQTNVQEMRNKYYNRQLNKQSLNDLSEYIEKVGDKMADLNKKFMGEMRHPNHTAEAFKSIHHAYNAACEDLENDVKNKRLDVADVTQIQTLLRALRLHPADLRKHLPFGFQPEVEEYIDHQQALQQQIKYYLGDLLALKNEYTHHQDVFQQLHDSLSRLCDNYILDIQDPAADMASITTTYGAQFREAVALAKQNFAKEPGTWQNLSPIVKGICTVLFFIKYFISWTETEVDKNRMYQPADKYNIQDRWQRWELDFIPELDLAKVNTNTAT